MDLKLGASRWERAEREHHYWAVTGNPMQYDPVVEDTYVIKLRVGGVQKQFTVDAPSEEEAIRLAIQKSGVEVVSATIRRRGR